MFIRSISSLFVICLCLALGGCENRPADEGKADAIEPVRTPQPDVELAYLSAEGEVVRALRTALFSTLRNKARPMTTNAIPPQVRKSHKAI